MPLGSFTIGLFERSVASPELHHLASPHS